MGNSAVKERFERAEKTKILTAHQLDIDSWDDIVDKLKTSKDLRTATFEGNKLKGSIPRSFLQVPTMMTLKSLDLSNNRLTDAVAFSALCPARAAREAALKHGKSAKDKDVFGFVNQMDVNVVLSVAAEIAAGRADTVPQYPLETLVLDGNQLTSLPPLLFAQFPKLKKLQLSRNKIQFDTIPPAVALLFASALVTLDLRENATITAFDTAGMGKPDVFSSHPNAADLANIAGSSLEKLEALQLAKCSVSTFTLSEALLKGVKSIDLSEQEGTGLQSVDESVFANAPKLNDIVIRGSKNITVIVEGWKASPKYREWEVKHASVIDRQLAGGADAKLMH